MKRFFGDRRDLHHWNGSPASYGAWRGSRLGASDAVLYVPPNAIFAARSDQVQIAAGFSTSIDLWPDQSGAGNAPTGIQVTAYPQLDSTTYGRSVIQGTNGEGYFSFPAAVATALLKGNDLPFTAAGLTRADNGDEFLGFGASIGAGAYLRFRIASLERLQLEKSDGSTTISVLSTGGSFSAGVWHSWAIRHNGATVDIWIDDPNTKNVVGAAQNVGDCSAAPTDGRFLTRSGIGSCLGSQTHAALLLSLAGESDLEIANVLGSLNNWKALL